MFCWTRSRSRAVAASVTTTNSGGNGDRQTSPILLCLRPPSALGRPSRVCDKVAFSASKSCPLSPVGVQIRQGGMLARSFGAGVEDANQLCPTLKGRSALLVPSEPSPFSLLTSPEPRIPLLFSRHSSCSWRTLWLPARHCNSPRMYIDKLWMTPRVYSTQARKKGKVQVPLAGADFEVSSVIPHTEACESSTLFSS
jgi:hypothetical protein